MAVAADVPNKYDVVIDGKGYMLVDSEEVKAQYGYTRTFVERQNTQGAFGDQFQDFWLTSSQGDWSLGEDQRFFRVNDEASRRRYYRATNVDVTVPGQVAMRQAVKTLTFAAAARAVCPGTASNTLIVASTTNLYEVAYDGTITDRGAHGLGASPSKDGLAFDGNAVFVSTTTGGTVGVRRMSSGFAYTTFSATPADSLAYLNNTLYGWRGDTDVLLRYDTAGTATTLFSFRDATGSPLTQATCKVTPFGSKLAIVRSSPRGGIWIYDGVGTSLLAQFEPDFLVNDVVESNGVLFVTGARRTNVGGTLTYRPAVLYYAGGQVGLLWQALTTTSGTIGAITAWNGSVVWTDDTTFQFLYYSPGEGGVQRIGSYSGQNTPRMAAGSTHFLMVGGGVGTSGTLHPDTSIRATPATVTSSLFDFDSSLDKLFRGIKVDFDSATDGNGGSVDIAYRVADVDGAYTTLQSGATSGTEYTLTGITGRSISVKVTLNKGTSTAGPVLKRVSVRGAPKQLALQRGVLIIQATGRDGEQPLQLRDGSFEPLDGLTLATNLRAIASAAMPVSMTHEFGTISNVVFENDGFDIRRVRVNEFIVVAPWREV